MSHSIATSNIHSRALARGRWAAKRGFDVLIAAAGLLVSAPLWAIICAAILIEDGRPIFFCKKCVGLGGRAFLQFKFRSMVRDADGTPVRCCRGRGIRASPAWASSCGAPRWTSCRS